MILVFEDKLGARSSCFPSRLNQMKIRSNEFFLRAQKFIGTADGTYRRAILWQSILDSGVDDVLPRFYESPSWHAPRSNRGVSRGFDIVVQLSLWKSDCSTQ